MKFPTRTRLSVILAFPVSKGAIAQHFLHIATELDRRGHEVVIVTDRRSPGKEGCRPGPTIVFWPSPRPSRIADARFLFRLVHKKKPNCMVANFGADNVMTTVGYLLRVPCRVVWYHTLTSQITLDSQQPAVIGLLQRLRKRLVYSMGTHIVANSEASATDVRHEFGVPVDKCRVFPYSLADPLQIVTESNARSTPPLRLCCPGRLYPSKGQDLVIRAIALLKDRQPQVNVDFVGDGPSRESLTKLAAGLDVTNNCTFLGEQSHDATLRIMAQAAITIVPSRGEAFGLVNVESLSVGTPVIGANVGGIPDIVRHQIDGLLVPPDDPAALASAISALLSNATHLERMRANARERFLGSFEQRRVVSLQADWIEDICREG
jgi:glycosyltransferase involved in cell wall biosynthesis